jgi:glycine/D-amino acid oxidase-like deaminating enzyme
MSFDSAKTIVPARKKLESQQDEALRELSAIDASNDVFDVLIVGSGISGATAAYYLTQATDGPKSILIIDRGEVGAGSRERFSSRPAVGSAEAAKAEDLGDEKVYHPMNSGGVVFSPPHFANGPTILKFSVRLYPTTTPNFIEHHGRDGTARYLQMAALGIEIQKTLTKKLCADPSRVVEERGSLLLAEAADEANLREEFALLQELGVGDCELWERARVEELHGKSAGFVAAIYFPNDARFDALSYTQALVAAARSAARCTVRVVSHCPAVIDVRDDATRGGTVTRLENGVTLRAKHAVVATNGLFLDLHLAGILVPCWSYFAALPHPRDPLLPQAGATSASAVAPPFMGGRSSHNYMTYGFSHDWCVTNGVYRVSGADHFSALKPPRAGVRSRQLAEWTYEKYPHMKQYLPPGQDIPGVRSSKPDADPHVPNWLKGRYVYGVYAETPDYLPLVGKTNAKSNVCYVVGCNAWGQASMTYSASLVPGLLGYAKFTPEQADHARDLAISRFKTQPVYLRGRI